MPTPFSPDYETARARFRTAVQQIECDLQAYPIDAAAPGGENLSIDVARLGPTVASKVLIVSSGLHGVEGFFGSAVQTQLLERWSTRQHLGRELALVLVHALNPFGFAWLRRANEENMDLNRNFLLKGEVYGGSPEGYAELQLLLNPQRPPSVLDAILFYVAAYQHLRRRGMPAIKQAVAGGQYDYPKGLFYGGKTPSALYRVLQHNLAGWIGDATRILHVDLHSGLGRRATYKLLLDTQVSSTQFAWLCAWFGDHRMEQLASGGMAYRIRGSLGGWCAQQLDTLDYTYLCAEFGTYSPIKMLAGLRAENQAHHWGQADDPASLRTKRRLKELFCPSSERWRHAVVIQCLQLLDKAVDALSVTHSARA